jgi:hypothetical protein
MPFSAEEQQPKKVAVVSIQEGERRSWLESYAHRLLNLSSDNAATRAQTAMLADASLSRGGCSQVCSNLGSHFLLHVRPNGLVRFRFVRAATGGWVDRRCAPSNDGLKVFQEASRTLDEDEQRARVSVGSRHEVDIPVSSANSLG